MKKFLIFSICLVSSFICFMNKTKAQEIEYNLPNTDVFFYYDLDTETFPYYIGVITSNPTNHTITFTLYYSSVEFRNEGGQYQYCVPVDSSYPNTICYSIGGKANGINAYKIYYTWDTINQHLLESNSNSPTSLNYGDIFIFSYYNIQDSLDKGFITYFDDYYYKFTDNVWVPFVLSYDITTRSGYVIESDYISSFSPTADYTISDGTETGKKLTFTFNNFDSDSHASITNLSSGEVINVSDLSVHTSYVIDNISYDSVYYVEVYNQNELVFVDTIDINQEVRLYNKPYIDLTLDKERLISWLDFYNLKENYHVYYSKNNGSFTEVQLDENMNHIRVGFNNDQPELHNKNYTIRGQITDENGNILYDRGYNIVFFKNQPYFTFNTSYSIDSGCNNLTITYHNSQNNDVLSYSYDNTTFSNFTNIKTNKLEVCASTPVYVKATRGNDTYYGYFYVNIEEFSSSSNEQYQQNSDLLSAFSNLFGNQDSSILENFSIFFNALKRSFIYKYLLLMILGAFILLIMKLIRR